MKLTAYQKQDNLHRRQFEKECSNYNLDFRRHPQHPEQYAEYQTELAYTFYNLGRLHK